MKILILVLFLVGYMILVRWLVKRHWERQTRQILDGVYAGVKVYESEGPPPPARSPGFATRPRQSSLRSPRGQAPP